LVILKNGEFYTTNFDPNNHYETDLLRIEKFDESKVWTAMLFDADQQGFLYVKRFTLERTAGTRHQSMIGDNPNTELLLLTDTVYPRLQVSYGGLESYRDPLEIDAEQFIGVKSYKAKCKRVTTLTIDGVEELEPLRFPEPEEEEQPVQANIEQPTDLVDEEGNIIDENTGQIRLPF
jgi:topoisomerase-4 subunit A